MEKIACFAVVALEFGMSVTLSHFQKNISNTMFFFALVSVISVIIGAVKNSILRDIGHIANIDYCRSQWKRYSQLDLASREKQPLDEFTRKLARAINATTSIISWGLNVITSATASLAGLIYIVVTSDSIITIILLIVINFVWFKTITRFFVKKYDEQKKKSRTIRDETESLCRLYSYRIHDFEDECIDQYIACEKATLDAFTKTDSMWSIASGMQQMPNFIVMMIIPYFVADATLYPIFVMVFTDFGNSVRNVSYFMNQWDSISKDIEDMNSFWKDKTNRIITVQENIPDQLDVNIHLVNNVVAKGLHIRKGGRYNIRGESGCGKTSLVRALIGQTNGAVLSSTDNPGAYKDKIVYMRQGAIDSIQLSKSSIRRLFYDCTDNDLIVRCLYMTRAEKWFENTMEKNLDTHIGIKISGGERARLCLAVMMYKVITKNAQWLILDEPEQGIDQELAPDMLRGIFREFPDLTIFLITHLCECKMEYLGVTTEWKIVDTSITVTTNSV
jgi:ABC-type multidrug transport system fused ATPase/permease subunit